MSASALQNTLRDPSLLRNIYVVADGQAPSAGREHFDVFDPASGEIIAHVANLDRDDARGMIITAEKAFSEWRARTAKERADALLKWYDAIMARGGS